MRPNVIAARSRPLSARRGKGIRLILYLSIQADDELDNPILAGFEWDREECYTRFIVHQKKEGAAPPSKKSKKKKEEGA